MKIILALVLTWPLMGFSEWRIGNGGDVILCPGKDRPMELLDYYEGQVHHEQTLVFTYQEKSVDEALEPILLQLARVSPLRAQIYRQRIAQFFSEAKFLKGQSFEDVPDSLHPTKPHGCELVQAIIQKSDELPGQKRYLVNDDLWQQLDIVTQAGLILHEVVYREAIEDGHKNSIPTRFLTSFLSSTLMKNYRPTEFAELLKKLDFRRTEYKGLWVLNSYQNRKFENVYYPDGRPQRLLVVPYQKMTYDGISLAVSPDDNALPTMHFYPDGKIKKFKCADGCGPFTTGLGTVWAEGQVEFYPSGSLRNLQGVREEVLTTILDQEVIIRPKDQLQIFFYEDGRIKNLNFFSPEVSRLELSPGQWLSVESFATATDSMEFYPHGGLKSFPAFEGELQFLNQVLKIGIKAVGNKSYYGTHFFADGNLRLAFIKAGQIPFQGSLRKLSANSFLEATSEGEVLWGRFENPVSIDGLQVFEFKKSTEGHLEAVVLAQGASLRLQRTSRVRRFKPYTQIIFNDRGEVVSDCDQKDSATLCFGLFQTYLLKATKDRHSGTSARQDYRP